MAFMEKVWRRLVEMIVTLQKDMLRQAVIADAAAAVPRVMSARRPRVAPRPDRDRDAVVETPGTGFTEITRDAARFLAETGAGDGVLLLFLRHTSASLVIQENADPDVQTDLVTALERLAPADAGWVHDVEGPDDMPAHVKSMLTGVSLHVPVHRRHARARHLAGHLSSPSTATQPHRREVVLQFIGACGADRRVDAAAGISMTADKRHKHCRTA